MKDKLYRVEALKGGRVVDAEPSWGVDSQDAINGVRRMLSERVAFDGIRATRAANIYDAYGMTE